MNLLTTPIPKLIWYYSLPSLIGTLVNALYNIVDRIYIGQSVGALAISGMSLTFPIMNILGAFGMLVGQGAATKISILLGKEKNKDANIILSNATILTIIFYILISSICLLYLTPILKLFGGTEHTIPYAKNYISIIIIGHIFTSFSYALTNIIRASGHPRYAMYTLLIGAILNIAIDPIFIFTFDLGIKGAAYATVVSMFISMICVFQFYFKKNSILHFSIETFRIDKQSIFKILSIGLSPFLLKRSTSLVNVLKNNTLLHTGGDLAIGAYGIITSYTTLIVMSIIGLSQGMQPIIGYNYGAQKMQRVKYTLKICSLLATLITTIGGVLGIIFAPTITAYFTSDIELQKITTNGMQIYLSTFFIVGFHIIVTNYFQSLGKAWISILLSISRQILLLIPLILILPKYFGLNGAWMAQPTSNILATIIAAIILKISLSKIQHTQN